MTAATDSNRRHFVSTRRTQSSPVMLLAEEADEILGVSVYPGKPLAIGSRPNARGRCMVCRLGSARVHPRGLDAQDSRVVADQSRPDGADEAGADVGPCPLSAGVG